MAPEPAPAGLDPDPAEDPFARDPLTAAPEPRPQVSAAAAEINSAEEIDIYATPHRRRMTLDRIASLVLAVMILIGLVAGAIQYRSELVGTWPTLGGLYARLGMPVNVRGLEIRDTAWEIQTQNGTPMLVVKGEIANTTRNPADVPRLSMVLRDARSHELYRWSADAGEVKRLAPGQVAPFTTTLKSPPLEAHDIEIRFLTGT
jgi:hypothetical protein